MCAPSHRIGAWVGARGRVGTRSPSPARLTAHLDPDPAHNLTRMQGEENEEAGGEEHEAEGEGGGATDPPGTG